MAKEEYAHLGKRIKDLEEKIDKAKTDAINEWKTQNPTIRDKIWVKTDTRCYPKGGISFSKVFPKILERILWQGWAKKTQKEILEDVQKLFPHEEVLANVWTKELEPWAYRKAEAIIAGSMQRPIKIKGCKNLSDIKRRLKAASHAGDGMAVYLPKIGINNDVVIVNKHPYTVDRTRKHPSIRVTINDKSVWLRTDALIELLKTNTV